MDKSFQYVIDNKGIDTEKAYPYVAKVSHFMNYHMQNRNQIQYLFSPSRKEQVKKAQRISNFVLRSIDNFIKKISEYFMISLTRGCE